MDCTIRKLIVNAEHHFTSGRPVLTLEDCLQMIAALYFNGGIDARNITVEHVLRGQQETTLEERRSIFVARGGQTQDEAIRARPTTRTTDIPCASGPLRRTDVSSKAVNHFRSLRRF